MKYNPGHNATKSCFIGSLITTTLTTVFLFKSSHFSVQIDLKRLHHPSDKKMLKMDYKNTLFCFSSPHRTSKARDPNRGRGSRGCVHLLRARAQRRARQLAARRARRAARLRSPGPARRTPRQQGGPGHVPVRGQHGVGAGSSLGGTATRG